MQCPRRGGAGRLAGWAGLVSSVLSSVTARHPRVRPYACWLDIFAVVATVMGVATSLGLGVLQMNGGLNAVFGLPENALWQFIILFVMFLAYMASTWSGLDKGIKRLSHLNMILCIGLMLYVPASAARCSPSSIAAMARPR